MLGDFEIFPFTALEEAEMLLRISLAVLVGGMIGYERRRSSAPAGIRTLALVYMGSGSTGNGRQIRALRAGCWRRAPGDGDPRLLPEKTWPREW